jgi:hypothetical protein
MGFAHKILRLGLVLSGIFLLSAASFRHVAEDEKVILVDLRVKTPEDAKKCFSSQFDFKRVELPLDIDDPLNTLEDFSLGEESLEGPGCFLPDLKIIFRTRTYVFSLFCTEVVEYRNSAPYIPSAKTTQSDVRITQSVLDVLEGIKEKYFGKFFDPEVAKRFVKDNKLDDLDDKVDDSGLYQDDDEDDADKEIAKDAIDKEGWFDEDKDPALEEDDTPETDDDDGGK